MAYSKHTVITQCDTVRHTRGVQMGYDVSTTGIQQEHGGRSVMKIKEE